MNHALRYYYYNNSSQVDGILWDNGDIMLWDGEPEKEAAWDPVVLSWVLSTGIWNDLAYWSDNSIWKD